MLSAEKQEADTRKSDFNPKMNAVSLRVMKDNADAWRERQEFPTQSEAEAFIDSLAGGTAFSILLRGGKETANTYKFVLPMFRHEIRHAYGRMQRRKVPRAHLRPVFHIIPFRNAFL